MKWLDSLGAWATVLKKTDERGIDGLIKFGEYFPNTQMIVVPSDRLPDFCISLSSLEASSKLLEFATGIMKEHNALQKPFFMRVEPDKINAGWQEQLQILFLKRALLNWRSLLSVKNSPLALEYVGQSWTAMDILDQCNPNVKELSAIAFQLLWTFAVLARCQIFLPISDWPAFFKKVFVQKKRVDYFGEKNNNETVFFVRGNSLKDAAGVFRVPVRSAFVHITYEPPKAISFGHELYDMGDRLVNVEHLCYDDRFDRAEMSQMTESGFFSLFSDNFCKFLFPDGQPSDDEDLRPVFTGLQVIASAKSESIQEFFSGPIAKPYWMNFKADDRANIVQVLAQERSLSVLFLPKPMEKRPIHRRMFRHDCFGFPNIDNNCFLNSVLFMLMFPKQSNNSFANTVNIYAGLPEPSEQESEAVRSLKAMIADVKELESMRRTLARFFSLSLKKAFLLSNNGLLESQTLIERQCSNLIPLLDLWSMASRGQFFTRVVGEYQDLDECLRLLHSLLLFESCTTSKIAITEEFPNLLYVDAEKLSIEAMEELSLRERNNPLCLRVQSTLESPILRHDWSLVGSDPHAVIDLQQMCSADQFECSIFPSPLNAEQKDSEKKTGVKHQRTTRFNLKRVMRSKDCNMAIIHIFRQSMDFINSRLVYTVKRNRVVFPQNEMLTIDGVCMRIHSLVLWSNSHYMSLVFCERTRRWWHINDMLAAGRRFQDFGPTLADAINFVNNFGMIVTTVACIPTQPRSAARELEQQCFVELPKFCLASDSMHLKAILIHKDQHRLLSARSVLSLISQPTFVLPNRFLFGPDDPNHDFIFRPDWFNGEPLVSQQSGIVLAIASGFSPSIQHALDVPLDHVVSLEKRISTMTSITIEATMQKIQARAANNIETIRCLQTGQRLNAKQFSNFTQAINARLVDCDAKQFIDSGSEKNAWYTLNAKSWIIDPVVMTVLMSDTMPLHARNTLGANYLRRSEDYALGPYFNLEKIVLPFYVQDRGFVVLVEPAKRQISFFDPFRKIDETSSVWIALFLVHLQRTFFKQPTACKEDWAVTHVLVDQSLANFELDLILLHICHEIMLGSESQLFSVFESKETTLDTLVQLFRRVGDMKK